MRNVSPAGTVFSSPFTAVVRWFVKTNRPATASFLLGSRVGIWLHTPARFPVLLKQTKRLRERLLTEENRMAVEIPVLTQQLQAFCLSQYGPDASVHQVEAMPGHAGLSFGFSVTYEKDGQPAHESLVMRLPPTGVRQSGNTDVLRQAPLLRALKKNGGACPGSAVGG